MNKKDRDIFQNLDSLLSDSAEYLAPDAVAAEITPYKSSMSRIIWGLGLTGITLNFLYLNFILPTIGTALLLLGFRSVRRENRWFSLCYGVSIIRTMFLLAVFFLNSTIYSQKFLSSGIGTALNLVNVALPLFNLIFLRLALGELSAKSSLPTGTGAVTSLIVWYVMLLFLALTGYRGIIIGLIMVLLYILTLVSLRKFSSQLSESGYAITPATVKYSDSAVLFFLAALLGALMTVGYCFFSSYHMDWEVFSQSQSEKTQQISQDLIELGFPEEILADMTEDDILACEGATEVYYVTRNHPLNDGRQVAETEPNDSGGTSYHYYTVYDVKELSVTGVAVKLGDERESWRIIHYFRWDVTPEFTGTEAIRIIPAFREYMGWSKRDDFSGQLLYTDGETSYSSPYAISGQEQYQTTGILGWVSLNRDWLGSFSMPNGFTDYRGYVTYSIEELVDGYIVDSWFYYCHQQNLSFPNITAREHIMSGITGGGILEGSFHTVDDAIQFNPSSDIRLW